MAAGAQGLAAVAGEGQRGGVEEHQAEVAEQVAPAGEQGLLDLVLDGAGRERGGVPLRLLAGQLLAEPSHRPVEVVQVEFVSTGDGVVGQPLLAGAVGARDHDPVQDGGEDRPLDRKGEGAAGEQLLDHRPAAGLLPQPAEDQGCADPACLQPRLVLGVAEGGEQQGLLAEPGAGGEESGEAARGGQLVEAAKGGDDLLADGAALAAVLDDLQGAARGGGLEAKKNGALQTRHHDTPGRINTAELLSAGRGTTFLVPPRAYRGKAQRNQWPHRKSRRLTVQDGLSTCSRSGGGRGAVLAITNLLQAIRSEDQQPASF